MQKNHTPKNVQKHKQVCEQYNNVKMAQFEKSWNEKKETLNLEKDTKKLWNLVKTLNEDIIPSQPATVLVEDGETLTGKHAANAMANCFKSESTLQKSKEETRQTQQATKLNLKKINPESYLSKAFDKVWKDGLLKKLTIHNIGGHMYHWISSYLKDRSGRVFLDGIKSNLFKIHEGVPQGGVISPTLFNIYINYVSTNFSKYVSHALHADDLAIWSSAEKLNVAMCRVQDTRNLINVWSKTWKVEINSIKMVTTCFSLSNKTETYRLHIEDKDLPQTNTPTYLGVKLDKRLTWRDQIQKMESKAIQRLSIMKKLAGTKWGSNSKTLKQVYTGSVRAVMEYGSTSWKKTSNKTIWTHIYTDGSAEEAINNGGGGIYIKFPNGKTISRSIPTGSLSSNIKAEAKAVHKALEILSQEHFPPSHAVIFTDCRSVLQKLSSPEDTTSRQIYTLLSQLSTTTTTSMQWIPAHYNIAGNDKVDSLAKCGSKLIQETVSTSYQEIKTIIKRKQKEVWKSQNGVTNHDPWETLERRGQITIVRLHTGHCRLNFHLHKLNLCHTSDCQCGTGLQTPEHILQQWSLHNSERSHFWPHGTDLHQKLWGSREDLQTTVQFITEVGLSV
ncbi:uncharacterized protein LOC121389807 [Gigantopelta aegis]|uniref:uncharacterized protein LOC121389807 n=1 Tax=Gigantopelta aegis TaxID=1735272 RepID=UPI001B88DC5D|nr:uncharacterized protein LOC121389807 [Gigantopelta aegis]